MRSRLELLHSCRPNARQLLDYTGETGFDECKVSGSAETRQRIITSMKELYAFLRDGEFRRFKYCYVKLTGQKTARKAQVIVQEDRTQLIAGNGMVIAQVSTVIQQ